VSISAGCFALGGEGGLLAGDFGLAKADAFAGLVEGAASDSTLGAGGGQRDFLGFGAFQAGELLVFQALGLASAKWSSCSTALGLGGVVRESCGRDNGHLLAVGADLAIEAAAERFFAAEGG